MSTEGMFSPINLLFIIIIIGFAVGKIRIKGISLGIAGILFTAIFMGFLASLPIFKANIDIATTQITMKTFSKLGSSLFVSVIGLQTGLSAKNHSKESIIAFAIGISMSISGVAVMLTISLLDQTITYSTLLGVLCGALTSTPGLSSVCEIIGINNSEAVWGYGCSYIFGVILTVLLVQLFTTKTRNQIQTNLPANSNEGKIYPELILISISALVGNAVSNIHISNYNISIDRSAIILLVGLILGYIAQKRAYKKPISFCTLNSFKVLGLSLFFVGTGFSAGIQPEQFNVRAVIYGSCITLTSIFCGILVCKLMSSKCHLNVGFIVAGGMTSSPAYGAISPYANESSVNNFSFAYFGSLFSLILALQIVAR